MPIKASDLIGMLADHIRENGDDYVMIYDDYKVVYKTIDKRQVSKNFGRFVIECPRDGLEGEADA